MPQIIYQESPASILSRAGGQVYDAREEMKEADRRAAAFALDKQRAEFELETAKQEQARKIESEDAYKSGVQWAMKYGGTLESPLQQQSQMIGQAQADPNQQGYRGKGALQIQTKAQEEFAAHEKQKLDEAQAIVSRMQPKYAEAFLQEVHAERGEERLAFERDNTLGDLGQLLKNVPELAADEGAAAPLQEVMQALEQGDLRDPGYPKLLDEARGMIAKVIDARAQSEAVGRRKIQTFEQAHAFKQQLEQNGGLDSQGLDNIEYIMAGLEGLPVHTLDDWEKYKNKLDEAFVRQQDATLRRRAKSQISERAASDPVVAGKLWDESMEEGRSQVVREFQAGLLGFDQDDPEAKEKFDREVFGRSAGIFQDRGGPRGYVEQKGRAAFPPSPIQQLKGRWKEMTGGPQGPGAQRRAAQAQQQGPQPAQADQRKQVLSQLETLFAWSKGMGPGGTEKGTPISSLKAGQRAAAYKMLADLRLRGVPLDEARAAMTAKGYALDKIDPKAVEARAQELLANEEYRERIGAGHPEIPAAESAGPTPGSASYRAGLGSL